MLEFFSFLPYLFFVVLGLHCCAGFSLVAAIGGVCVGGGAVVGAWKRCSLSQVYRLLVSLASLVAEHWV